MMSCMKDTKVPSLSKCIFIKLMKILTYILKIPNIQATNPDGSTFLAPKPHIKNYPEPLLTMSHSHNHFFNTDLNVTPHSSLGLPSDHKPEGSNTLFTKSAACLDAQLDPLTFLT